MVTAKKEDFNKKEVREILNDGTPKGHNSRGRGRSQAERRESYRKYREIKRRVFEFEKKNHGFLILWPASDHDTNEQKFYNMGGNSAIIYVHEIGPRIKRKPSLRLDLDSGDVKFGSGICSIANVEQLAEALAGIGVKRARVKRQGYDDFIFFKLNREYPESEIREMLRDEQKQLEKLNKVIYATVLYPDIHRQILDLEKVVPRKVKNMDSTYREIVGVKMIDALVRLVELYSQMAHGDIGEYEAGKEMLLGLDSLLAQVSMMNELRLWDILACARVADIAVGAKQLIKGKIINKVENDTN